jgi:predicted ferric reductase
MKLYSFTSKIGWPIIVTIAALPVFLWTHSLPLSDRFTTPAMIFISIGELLGLVGMSLFAINMILSTRLPFFENLFGGVNQVYIVHHQLGGISIVLLLLHPLSLSIQYLATSIQSALLFFLPSENWAVNFGITSLLILGALLILTFYVELPYQIWRFSHKFIGIAFFIGGIHSLLVTSDVSRDPLLRIYMLCLVALGLLGYFWRTVLGRWLVPKFHYTVGGILPVATDVVQMTLLPSNEKHLVYTPGQFVFISFSAKGVSDETHPFSISSSPNATGFTLVVKALGDFTKWISQIPVGANARVEGPYGRFSYAYHTNPKQIWVAGGIGITPFLSMARSLEKGTRTIDLYYSVREESEAVYLSELTMLSTLITGFRVFPWYTKTAGRLTGEEIAKRSGDIHDYDVYVCGPPAMMKSVKSIMIRMGVPAYRIYSEEFGMT